MDEKEGGGDKKGAMPKTQLIIGFSEQEIENLRDLIEDKDLVEEDELEELKKKSGKMLIDSTILAEIFLKCYNYLYVNQHLFKNEDKDYTQKLKNYLGGFDIQDLRNQLEEYGKGVEFGSYYVSRRIKNIVSKDRRKMIDLVLLFFKLFGEEE